MVELLFGEFTLRGNKTNFISSIHVEEMDKRNFNGHCLSILECVDEQIGRAKRRAEDVFARWRVRRSVLVCLLAGGWAGRSALLLLKSLASGAENQSSSRNSLRTSTLSDNNAPGGRGIQPANKNRPGVQGPAYRCQQAMAKQNANPHAFSVGEPLQPVG